MVAVGARFVSPGRPEMMWRGVAKDQAGAGAGAGADVGAAAACEHWHAVAMVEAGTCAALGMRRIDRRRVSPFLKDACSRCTELVGDPGNTWRLLGGGGGVRDLD